uniref:Reverse transcriptase Ty1/copia-type domain-containing protein n=1 Tax=Nicotiana tabacum TaxID=4097 RepID=A0A1S4BW25_TOBAC|nr:PREDICTED: uncharacterized protein LOC107812464 [Nicotiana tabacum]
MRAKLPLSVWGHAVLHAATLVRIRPTNYHNVFPLQLAFGQEPNIFHLKFFGCAVYVPIAPPKRTKMSPQRRLGVYVDAFTNLPRVTKSHIPVVNAPIRVDVPTGQYDNANESRPRLKRGRPIVEIMQQDVDLEPKSIDECRQRNDWPKWKNAIQTELASLEKHEVFGPIVRTPEGVKPVGYKWVFVRKQNEKGEVVRYKARLVAQGFSQRPDIDYMDTYSPVVDAITFS